MILTSFLKVSAQKYGNEWIDTSKVHVKIKVAKDAIYRVGYFAVESHFTDAGQFISTIPFSQFRMYSMGEEVPIYVKDQNNNNKFDPFDYIEFVGHPIDGKFDAELYSNPGDQTHQLISIISDTNYYYLSYRTAGTGLRYQNYTNNNPPATAPREFHQKELSFVKATSYHYGLPLSIANHLVYLSEYSSGEGFVGDNIFGSSDTSAYQYQIALKTPHAYKGQGAFGWVETGFVGASVNYTNINHRVVLEIGASETAVRRIFDTSWMAHGVVKTRVATDTADFGDKTYLYVSSRFINGINYSVVRHTHTLLNYSKYYNFGDSVKYIYVEDTSSVPVNIKWEQYGDGFFSLPVIYDETNRTRIDGTYSLNSRTVEYTLPAMNKPGKMYIDDEGRIVEIYNSECEGVMMRDFSKHINKFNHYIILTSRSLLDGPKEEVKKYAALWSSRYNVSLLDIDDLYNSFSYGIKHPLAVRKYCRYLLEKSNQFKPQYLLLLGRGYDMSYNRGSAYAQLKPNLGRNHIPAIGTPSSDFMYTSGLDGTNQEPAIPTGRIPADTESDIGDYLEKLQGYLNAYNNYEPWQKTILHLSGGASGNQATIIKNRLQALEKYPQADPFAGQVHSYSKAAGGSVDVNFRTSIQNEINTGINLITFLGHGSSTVTDIDIGDPADYLNENKYPICYFNGCQVGNVTIPQPLGSYSLAERVFRARKKGAVAFIGQTSTSELYAVSNQMEHFYKAYFDSSDNRSIGNVLQKTIKTYQDPQSVLNRMHCQELFLQGDPALPVYSPQLPDFAISTASVFLDPPNAIALQDSFRVGVIITNLGRGLTDSFTIDLNRTYPDGSTKRHYSTRWSMRGYSDTAYIVIRSKDIATAGDNIFEVKINQLRNPVEFNYNNNNITRVIYMAANGINMIMPVRFAILGTDSVDLVVQKSDLFKESEDFYIELDTTPWFNSPLLLSLEKNNTPLTAGALAVWRVKLPSLRDTQVYFWRARINVPADQGGAWTIQSFTYIRDHSEGWMQNLHWQYEPEYSRNQYSDLSIDSAGFGLEYSRVSKKIYLDCDYRTTSNKGVKESGFAGQDMNFGVCSDGIVAIPWDGRRLERKPVDVTKSVPNCFWGLKWTTFGHFEDYQLYYSFDMASTSEQDRFIAFIDAMEDSMYVTFYTRKGLRIADWKPEVFQSLNKVGCTVFDTAAWRVQDAMWVALGRKGWPPGKAQEAVTRGGQNPYCQLEAEMVGISDHGSMTSELIGPTNSFNQLIYRPLISNDGASEDDVLTVDVLGLKSDGKYDVLRKNLVVTNSAITNINPDQYKFLKLRVNSEDALARTSPNLFNWRVLHDSVPEGTLFPDARAGYLFHEDTLYEGDTFRLRLPFKNISHCAYRDSIHLVYSVFNKIDRVILDQGSIMFPPLNPDSMFYFNYKMQTTELEGPYGIQISVNQGYEQPEKTLVNNSSLINFYILRDVVTPVLDVTFDGRHILNGDIVSATPFIKISSTDENKFLLQNDTSTFDVLLKKPGSPSFEKITPGAELQFYPATDPKNQARIEYRPTELPSGMYTLSVQSRDAKLNQAGKSEYQIDFNVIREQSVTNFYPYPNPFSDKMRFVFTLTGSELPDNINIKIMTAEGRVVKELQKEDLGDIRVGNNVTDWYWDGTDQFGDKLGNGTYFYKVSVTSNGEDLKLRATKGDNAFKEKVGVIYLLR